MDESTILSLPFKFTKDPFECKIFIEALLKAIDYENEKRLKIAEKTKLIFDAQERGLNPCDLEDIDELDVALADRNDLFVEEATSDDIHCESLFIHWDRNISLLDYLKLIYKSEPYLVTESMFTKLINHTGMLNGLHIGEDIYRKEIKWVSFSERVFFMTIYDNDTRDRLIELEVYNIGRWLTKLDDDRYIGLTEDGVKIYNQQEWVWYCTDNFE
jgi:hypothetical protein